MLPTPLGPCSSGPSLTLDTSGCVVGSASPAGNSRQPTPRLATGRDRPNLTRAATVPKLLLCTMNASTPSLSQSASVQTLSGRLSLGRAVGPPSSQPKLLSGSSSIQPLPGTAPLSMHEFTLRMEAERATWNSMMVDALRQQSVDIDARCCVLEEKLTSAVGKVQNDLGSLSARMLENVRTIQQTTESERTSRVRVEVMLRKLVETMQNDIDSMKAERGFATVSGNGMNNGAVERALQLQSVQHDAEMLKLQTNIETLGSSMKKAQDLAQTAVRADNQMRGGPCADCQVLKLSNDCELQALRQELVQAHQAYHTQHADTIADQRREILDTVTQFMSQHHKETMQHIQTVAYSQAPPDSSRARGDDRDDTYSELPLATSRSLVHLNTGENTGWHVKNGVRSRRHKISTPPRPPNEGTCPQQ